MSAAGPLPRIAPEHRVALLGAPDGFEDGTLGALRWRARSLLAAVGGDARPAAR